jgi:hypothetical protein
MTTGFSGTYTPRLYQTVVTNYGSLTPTDVPPPDDAENIGYEQQVNNGPITVESFLNDRKPPPKEEPEEDAEIRWGAESDFEYDISNATGTPDFIAQDQENDGVFFRSINYNYNPADNNDFDDDDDGVPDPPQAPAVVYDVQEVARSTEVVRVTGTGGMYVDIERIVWVIFEMPARYGPDGAIKEFWKLNMNWGRT